MNAIPVIDQKQKLLEMCKHFFPETNNWMDNYVIIHKQTCDICVKEYVLKGIFFKEYDEEDEMLMYVTISNGDRIHWFEFCTNHLVNSIAFENIESDILADCEFENNRIKLISEIFRDKYSNENFHIIDYLYEEFKKLKNE